MVLCSPAGKDIHNKKEEKDTYEDTCMKKRRFPYPSSKIPIEHYRYWRTSGTRNFIKSDLLTRNKYIAYFKKITKNNLAI